MENSISEINRTPTKIETLFWEIKYVFAKWFNKNILRRKSNTHNIAKRELDILAATVPDAIVTPFAKEILALCEAFGNSGQSGGSAPYTASAISQAVNKLMLHKPICDVTAHEIEWVDVTQHMGETMWQNSRCGGLFKHPNGKCSYNDAIIWQGEEEWDTFSGQVYIDNKDFELIGGRQYVNFPFEPKTFYIDVIRVPINKEEAKSRKLHYIEDGDDKCYYTIIKNPKQLDEVFKYYNKK